MAEELLLLGALLDAANRRSNVADQEKESENWVVPCVKSGCDGKMQRVKGHQAYNTALNSTILCDGCKEKVPGTKIIFHCPKNQNLFHLNGFDFCLNCAQKHRDKSAERPFFTQVNNNDSYNNPHSPSPSPRPSPSPPPSQSNAVQEIAQHKRTINRLRNEFDEYQQNTESSLISMQNEKDALIVEKRDLDNCLNDNLGIIDHQKDEIQTLKCIIQSLHTERNSNNNNFYRFKNEKAESQNKYRAIKQQLDDKLHLIEQYKGDIRQLKAEKQQIINTYNQTTGKNEISPTLKAIFTQKFFADDDSKRMEPKQYITKIHNEILGMCFASHATLEWMRKNCKVYDAKTDNNDYNVGSGDIFSFNSFINTMNDNNNIGMNRVKPMVNLKEFDLMTMQRLQKNLNGLEAKYNQCINSTKEWKEIIGKRLNEMTIVRKANIYEWQHWDYNNIIEWMMGLENGRFLKYKNILQIEMGKVALTGSGLKQIKNVDLLMYGINDFKDQMVLVQQIDALTGRKQKEYARNIPAPTAYNTEQIEGAQTPDIK